MIAIDTVVAAIEAHLEAVAAQTVTVGNVGVTRFNQVIQGPVHLPQGDRIAAFWVSEVTDTAETFGNVLTTYRFTVGLYWEPRPATSDHPNLEMERLDSLRAVRTRFRADSTLGGAVTDLDIGPALSSVSQGVAPNGQPLTQAYIAFTFDLLIEDYEGEAIAP